MMTQFALSTDSGAEAFIGQRLADTIFVIPFTYTRKDLPKQHADYFYTHAEYEQFYTQLDTLDTVCPPTAQAYEAYFDTIFETGITSILHITASSGLCQSYANAVKAAKNTLIKFRRHEIYIVDSLTVSAGQRLLVDTAKALRDSNIAAAQALQSLQSLTKSIATFVFPQDSKYYLTHSTFGELLRHGNILSIQPLAALNQAGAPALIKNCRGQKAAHSYIRKAYESLCRTDISTAVYISAAGNFSAARTLQAALSADTDASEIFWMGPPLGAVTGKDALCAAFYAKDFSYLRHS